MGLLEDDLLTYEVESFPQIVSAIKSTESGLRTVAVFEIESLQPLFDVTISLTGKTPAIE